MDRVFDFFLEDLNRPGEAFEVGRERPHCRVCRKDAWLDWSGVYSDYCSVACKAKDSSVKRQSLPQNANLPGRVVARPTQRRSAAVVAFRKVIVARRVAAELKRRFHAEGGAPLQRGRTVKPIMVDDAEKRTAQEEYQQQLRRETEARIARLSDEAAALEAEVAQRRAELEALASQKTDVAEQQKRLQDQLLETKKQVIAEAERGKKKAEEEREKARLEKERDLALLAGEWKSTQATELEKRRREHEQKLRGDLEQQKQLEKDKLQFELERLRREAERDIRDERRKSGERRENELQRHREELEAGAQRLAEMEAALRRREAALQKNVERRNEDGVQALKATEVLKAAAQAHSNARRQAKADFLSFLEQSGIKDAPSSQTLCGTLTISVGPIEEFGAGKLGPNDKVMCVVSCPTKPNCWGKWVGEQQGADAVHAFSVPFDLISPSDRDEATIEIWKAPGSAADDFLGELEFPIAHVSSAWTYRFPLLSNPSKGPHDQRCRGSANVVVRFRPKVLEDQIPVSPLSISKPHPAVSISSRRKQFSQEIQTDVPESSGHRSKLAFPTQPAPSSEPARPEELREDESQFDSTLLEELLEKALIQMDDLVQKTYCSVEVSLPRDRLDYNFDVLRERHMKSFGGGPRLCSNNACGRRVLLKSFDDLYSEEEFRIWNTCKKCQALLFTSVTPTAWPECLVLDIGEPGQLGYELSPCSYLPVAYPDFSVIWPTCRHLYEAQRYHLVEIQERIRCCATHEELNSVLGAPLLSRFQRRDWSSCQISCMRYCLMLRQAQHPRLQLLMTSLAAVVRCVETRMGDAPLWSGVGGGENMVGRILMEARDKLLPTRPAAPLEPSSDD